MQDVSDRQTVHVLIACADVPYGATLADFIAHGGYDIERCHDARGVLRLASRRDFDVMVLDLGLDAEASEEEASAPVDLISFVRQKNPSTRLILLFEVSMLDRALDGIRHGAFFYLPRSSPPSDVALVMEKAARDCMLEAVADGYEQTVFEELVGHTPAMRRVAELVRKVAPTDSTVLLLGESGTGKEVLANMLHRLSRRSDKPFVAINCAALPESLLESEMFGHVKGAFTGADKDKRGLFEEADGGTLFLDEIGDMSPLTQAKLLRVLQDGVVRPVGATAGRQIDLRLLAATNQDLVEAVRARTFREDLYFRLNVIQIRIPPLRERMDALPTLITHFLARYNAKFQKQVRILDPHAMGLLGHYEFPGNVRELESIIAHAVIMAEGDTIRARDLPEQVQHGIAPRLGLTYNAEQSLCTLAEAEEEHIRRALDKLEGNQTNVAKKLGISRSTLWRKMREYGIEKP